MKLRELAHARTGDKGNVSNISVIAHEPGDYAFLAEHVTAERVKAHFADIVHGRVERYELPGIGALNFVLHDALGGGVTDHCPSIRTANRSAHRSSSWRCRTDRRDERYGIRVLRVVERRSLPHPVNDWQTSRLMRRLSCVADLMFYQHCRESFIATSNPKPHRNHIVPSARRFRRCYEHAARGHERRNRDAVRPRHE